MSYELAYYETSSPPALQFNASQLQPLVARQPLSSVAFALPFSDTLKMLLVTIVDSEGDPTAFLVPDPLQAVLQANVTLCTLEQVIDGS